MLLLSTFTLMISTGCAPTPVDTHDSDVKAIKDTEAAWNQAFSAKDAEKTVRFYTDDACLLSANEPVVCGRDGIKQALGPLLADANFSLHFESVKVDVAKSGEIAYSQGTYTMTLTDPGTKKSVTDKGKYLTVFKKQAGDWKAVEDAVSSDQPLPAATQTKPRPKIRARTRSRTRTK
jgi:uncharacterized protein (TIGR02246 family)